MTDFIVMKEGITVVPLWRTIDDFSQYLIAQPWIVLRNMNEDDIFKDCVSRVELHCLLCDQKHIASVKVPPEDDPFWKDKSSYGIPEALAAVADFQLKHLHKDDYRNQWKVSPNQNQAEEMKLVNFDMLLGTINIMLGGNDKTQDKGIEK